MIALVGPVTDPNGINLAFATVLASLIFQAPGKVVTIAGAAQPQRVAFNLDATGSFPAGSQLTNNDGIFPSGSLWTFTVYPLCGSAPQVIGPVSLTAAQTPWTAAGTSAGVWMSSQLAPFLVPSAPLCFAYAPGQITNPLDGHSYINTVTDQHFFYVNGTWTPIAASQAINQLTGDVIVGPGSGSQAATVVAIHAAGSNPLESIVDINATTGQLNSFNQGDVTANPNLSARLIPSIAYLGYGFNTFNPVANASFGPVCANSIGSFNLGTLRTGMSFRRQLKGSLTTGATNPGVITVTNYFYGQSTTGPGPYTLPANLTNQYFEINCDITVESVNVAAGTAQVSVCGYFIIYPNNNSVTDLTLLFGSATTPCISAATATGGAIAQQFFTMYFSAAGNTLTVLSDVLHVLSGS